MVDAKSELVERLRSDKYVDLARDYGFGLRQGRGAFADAETIECGGDVIRGRRYLIATGSSRAIPRIDGLGDVGYLTSTTARELREAPRELAVICASVVGLELEQLFLRLGSTVTFLGALPRHHAPTAQRSASRCPRYSNAVSSPSACNSKVSNPSATGPRSKRNVMRPGRSNCTSSIVLAATLAFTVVKCAADA